MANTVGSLTKEQKSVSIDFLLGNSRKNTYLELILNNKSYYLINIRTKSFLEMINLDINYLLL